MSRNHDSPVTALGAGSVSEHIFSAATAQALRQIAAGHSPHEFPTGAVLFHEGEPAEGVFLLIRGAVKLSVSASNGEKLVLRTAGAGEILGLSVTLTGQGHETTAETTGPSQLIFIPRKDFLRFLRTHSEICLQVVESLSNDLYAAYERVRKIGLPGIRHN